MLLSPGLETRQVYVAELEGGGHHIGTLGVIGVDQWLGTREVGDLESTQGTVRVGSAGVEGCGEKGDGAYPAPWLVCCRRAAVVKMEAARDCYL